MEKDNLLNNNLEELKNKKKRRDLLPWWIKVFCWFFMLFGLMSIVCLILGFTNIKPALAIYGFETNEPFSLNGIIVITIGIIKGITAFSLWFEKDFAIKIGKIDAIIGIILCGLSMLVLPFLHDRFNINIRLELTLIIPFLLKLNKIQNEWENLKK
jgi:hypothetical protein